MKQLQNLQSTFQQSVLNPSDSASIEWVSASGRVTPKVQLSIYCFAYEARLKEVLMNDYPAMLMAIGEDQFVKLTESYIKSYPSHYFSLREFGCNMPDFVLAQGGEHKDWLHELSLFEWLFGEAFDAADDSIFTEQDMASISPDQWSTLKFILHPSVNRLDFEWNTPEMWQALTDDEPKEVKAKREITSSWLIWREKLITRFRSMQTDEQLAFDTMSRGGDFHEVCETLANIMNADDVPLHAASLLKGWINQGLIKEIK